MRTGARIEFPLTARDSGLKHVSPWYQQGAWDLGNSENTKPRGVHVGWGGLRPRGPLAKRKAQ